MADLEAIRRKRLGIPEPEVARPPITDADAAADLAGTPRPDNPTVATTASFAPITFSPATPKARKAPK